MEKGNKIMLIFSAIAFAASVFFYYESSSYQKKAVQTEGQIIDCRMSSYNVRFFTQENVEKIKYVSRKNHKHHEGDIVNVYYRADNPDKVRFTDGKKEVRTFIIVGVICFLLGIYPLFLKKKVSSSVS